MRELPSFGLEAYEQLLRALQGSGYAFAPVAELPSLGVTPTVLLRHDVDLDPPSTLPMAEVEARLGLVATYYVPLTQHFNALEPRHREAITRLRELGHEIGLHYDMRTYPLDAEQAREHLSWEVDVLARASGGPVRTICMHQPHRGHPDPFRALAGFVHPHDPRLQDDLLYVSDSCRAWRDASLLRAFASDRPRRILVNFHPELWLAPEVATPLDYLGQVIIPLAVERAKASMEAEASAWRGHATAKTVR